MKLIFVDVETTGLEYPESGLIQLAGAIEIDGQVRERFDFRMRPFPDDVISDDALAIHGITREQIAGYDAPAEVFRRFEGLLGKYIDRYDKADKFHFVAYNAQFDAEHLRAWFLKNGDRFFGSWFFHPPLDVMGMAALTLMGQRHKLQDFRLPTVAQTLGIVVDPEKVHDAGYDVEPTRALFQRLLRDLGLRKGETSNLSCRT